MKTWLVASVAGSTLFLSVCAASEHDRARSEVAIQSIQTALGGGSCRREIDKSDPNETPYLLCRGIAGFALIVRLVDAGRQSIDVVDPAHQVHPLSYDEFVTRSMSAVGDKAEWRVLMKRGKPVPFALIVRVLAHEDDDTPEKVTSTYYAVTKITPEKICVTDRVREGVRSEAEVRRIADSAPDRPCASPRPHMKVDGVIIR